MSMVVVTLQSLIRHSLAVASLLGRIGDLGQSGKVAEWQAQSVQFAHCVKLLLYDMIIFFKEA